MRYPTREESARGLSFVPVGTGWVTSFVLVPADSEEAKALAAYGTPIFEPFDLEYEETDVAEV